ncbi:MAG TPA: hypothetical protein VIH93_00600 [Thermoanaerobaculia bacterium]|jgi:hypothetical protein
MKHMSRSHLSKRTAVLCLFTAAALGALARPCPAADPVLAGVPPFELRSSFWVNLHHFLYQQALPAASGAGPAPERAGGDQALGPEERKAWSESLEFYRASITPHDLSEREMRHTEYLLADVADAAQPSRSTLEPKLAAALERAAPAYRAHWWAAHDRANRFWISVVTPMVQQLGGRIMGQIAAAYGTSWPPTPILVDVAVYANWAGAYTTLGDPMHTIISSTDPTYQAFAAFEMLFHEASHTLVDGRNGRIPRTIERECLAQKKAIPRDLTHAIIFYTAGELARRDLADAGVAGYVPYAERNGLWGRSWPRYKASLERFWLPYLDGKSELDGAIAQLVGTLPDAAPATPKIP